MTRNRYLITAIVSVIATTFSIGAFAMSPATEDFHLMIGGKLMNRDDWAPAEDQLEGGGGVSYQPANSPVGFTVQYLTSYGNGDSADGVFRVHTREIQAGLEHVWVIGSSLRPYIEGGGDFGKTRASLQGFAESGHGVGGWIAGGITWILPGHLALGAQSGYSYFPVTISGVHAQGGGFHIDGTLGVAW